MDWSVLAIFYRWVGFCLKIWSLTCILSCYFTWIYVFCFRQLNCIIVKGLGQVGSSGAQHSPDALKSRMSSVLRLVGGGLEFSVVGVVVYSARHSPIYNVELDSTAAVTSLLREFFKFTRRNNPVKRPPELESVSLHHSVTPGTRIRISLLRVG